MIRFRVLLIQPPLMQLNGPYPSLYYLKSFLRSRGTPCRIEDHAIGLFERVFSAQALGRIFAEARKQYEDRPPKRAGERRFIERFLSEETRWLAAIDRLILFLRGKDREWAHLLSLAHGVLPAGPRFDALAASLGGGLAPEHAPLLATKLLEDLADFITIAVDPCFALIRYGRRPAEGVHGRGGCILRNFYEPYLEEAWDVLEGEGSPYGRNAVTAYPLCGGSAPATPPPGGQRPPGPPGYHLALGITIPFPGCLAGALACAQSAKRRFGDGLVVIGGGGYVNTELRDLKAGFDAFDYFVFDRGYGALAALLDRLEAEESGAVYKTLCQSRRDGRFIKGPGIDGPAEDQALAPYAALDREGARTVFPDYQGVDFSRYLYPLDDANPMHRLWSDGHWLKAYLAHGCYWRGCAFCDTALDYIRAFEPVDPASLFNHLKAQAEQTGVRAVHLVDEAVPPASLIRFAELNRAAGLPLIFWGNIRFDRAFNPDAAALLAAGGLIGVSGGIEVASPQGFKRLGKGIDLADAVRVCAAFKEQGVLTHAYLIYGYWDESPQELIDSVETLRQLFAAGLLDSAFWHKFVLTRHSRLYAEWRRGLHPGLRVLDSSPAGLPASFAPNDLRFAGEEGFDRYTGPLDRLLAAWMAGDTTGTDRSNPAAWAFPFPLPRPQTPPDLVIQLLDKYARERDCFRAKPPAENQGRVLFLGGRPVLSRNAGGSRLAWRWHGEERRLCLAGGAALEQGRALAALLEQAGRSSAGALGFYEELRRLLGAAADDSWRRLRTQGLIYREQIVDSVCP